MSETLQYRGGVGFLGLLALMFILLRLVGVITWSWWWVLAPLWMPLAAVLAAIIVIVAGYGLIRLGKRVLGD